MNKTQFEWLAVAVAVCSLAAAMGTRRLSAQVDRGRGAVIVGGDSGRGSGSGGGQRASCVLQLDFDPNRGSRGFESQTLNAMLTSTALVDPAAEKALGLGPQDWPKVAQIELVQAGNAAVRLGVTITPNAGAGGGGGGKLPANPAQAFLDELTARAKTAVEQVGARQEQANAERMAALEKEQAAARERLEKVQGQLREARTMDGGGGGGGGDMDPRMTSRSLASERQTLEVNLAAQKARLKVIQEELQRLQGAGGATTRGAPPAPVNSPWADLVAAREKLLTVLRKQHESGIKTETDVLQAEADLAEARAMAATAVANAGSRLDPRGGVYDPAERWQTEAVNLRANIAEAEVRLASLVERAKKFGASGGGNAVSPFDVDRLRQDEMNARQTLSDVSNQIEQLRRDRRSSGGGVRLLVLDGKPRP